MNDFEQYYIKSSRSNTKADRNIKIWFGRNFHTISTLAFIYGISKQRVVDICKKLDKIHKDWIKKGVSNA